ncbi:MAG TPA: pyruvate formate lyase-activating protein [Clostridiales bacterium]|nr:pyruvate formate lyase-activating protein [Clostridiales bacterium]
MEVIGRIHSLESFGTVDGPGIRFVVFMQGCVLRCQFCHNPDTWDPAKGEEYTVEQLMDEIRKYKSYMEFSGGGVTFTGGEPLMQAEFILEVVKRCKQEGISVALDTSGFIWNNYVQEVLKYTDIVLLDIKSYDPLVYKTVTGVSLAPTLKLLEYLREENIETWVRIIIVPNLMDDLESIRELSNYLDDFTNVSKIELLGFHKMGEYKWKELGMEYQLYDTPEPTKELMNKVKEILKTNGKNVVVS